MQQLEIEVKFFISDLSLIRRQIEDLGGRAGGSNVEINLRFDDRLGTLFESDALLRLRKIAGKNVLTHKSIPAHTDRSFKVFNELEISVSDFETTKQILESLGFFQQQVYEKRRETIDFNHTLVCLDEMPYGDFVEIEGRPDDIRTAAAQLGMDWNRRILMNYLEIFSQLKTALQLPFSDVTFDNFKSHRVDPADVRAQLELILVENRE